MSLESLARTETLADLVATEILVQLARRRQSQAALARALAVPAMWVSDRLNGKVQMSLNDVARIAETLGLEVLDLFTAALNRRYAPGHFPMPDQPIVAAAVPIPVRRDTHRQLSGSGLSSGAYATVRKTSPTGR